MVQNNVILRHKIIQYTFSHELGSEQSEWASEQMSAAEHTSVVSSAEQANKWAVRANKQTVKQVTQYLRLDTWLFQTIVRLYRR